jgi:hypothetical protein
LIFLQISGVPPLGIDEVILVNTGSVFSKEDKQ